MKRSFKIHIRSRIKNVEILLKQIITVVFLISNFTSCDIQEQWNFDSSSARRTSISNNYYDLTQNEISLLEGIYKVNYGNDFVGDTLVLKYIKNKIAVFGVKDGFYSIMEVKRDSVDIVFNGEWRFALNKRNGNVFLKTNYNEFLNNIETYKGDVFFSGDYMLEDTLRAIDIHLSKIENLNYEITNNKFHIIAHRGGGRTADHLPYSENSIEMINFSEQIGSTGIEIDVQLTKDNIPVLYHDPDLNIRLIKKGPLIGFIKDYNLNQLKKLVKLIHGEQIPTLEEALDFVIEKTQISLILLDIKNSESFNFVIPIQKKYIDIAREKGKEVEILISIQTNEVYESFKKVEGYTEIPSCCTMEKEKVKALNSSFWNYRWTQGILTQELIEMHSMGKRCTVWTLDVPEFIDLYVSHGKNNPLERFDGILTNYPSIVAYYHYVRHNK
ncbi:MAG: glycerophosphodiester phosphodiesterase [Prolixibacteraceae bacterium]|nr:glycerophosphodiester phosphodiesterase [Prolixibacteraceae bacterium]